MGVCWGWWNLLYLQGGLDFVPLCRQLLIVQECVALTEAVIVKCP